MTQHSPHHDPFNYRLEPLLDPEPRDEYTNGIRRTLIADLQYFTASGPDNSVRLIFRGNRQRTELRLKRHEAARLCSEIEAILNRPQESDYDE